MTVTAAAQHAANDAQEPLSFDDRLQASRRVDWRFLLPDPQLGHVAYLGPERSALAEAMFLFSRSLIHISRGQNGPQQYDTVVLHNPKVEYIPMMTQLVAPGGVLYLEAYGLLGKIRQGGRLNRLYHPTQLTAMLHKLGFVNNQLHWHWPDFDHCTKMIPFDDRAITYFMTSTSSRRSRLFKGAFGRGLVRSGLLMRLIPCFSVVGRRE